MDGSTPFLLVCTPAIRVSVVIVGTEDVVASYSETHSFEPTLGSVETGDGCTTLALDLIERALFSSFSSSIVSSPDVDHAK